jgi:glycosyltransferase involved in cell wall biosynthesis
MPNVSRAFGGPTESLIGYTQAATTQGLDVHVAAPDVSAEDATWLRRQLPEATFHGFAAAGRHAYVVAPGLWAWLGRAGSSFDVVHVHGLFNPVSSLSARVSVARGYPTVMRPFGTLSRYTFSRRSALKRLYFRWIDRPALQQAAALHFTTEAEEEEARRLPLAFGDRAHVVPPPWRGSTAPPDLNAKAERPTVLFMSRLHPKKNVSGLIEAWRHVVDAHPDAQLWIAGDGDAAYVERLHDAVADYSLSDAVSFLGFVQGDEKARVLRKAWAFALPSHQENFGVAVLEAVAAGLPVVISPEVQLRAFVDAHDLGHVADRHDPAALASALDHLLTDAAFRARVATAGPQAVATTFALDRIGQQLAALYQRVAASA